jgi:hypothetical protein
MKSLVVASVGFGFDSLSPTGQRRPTASLLSTSETLRANNEDFARNSEFPRLIRVFHQEIFFRFLDDSIQIPLEVDEDHQEM